MPALRPIGKWHLLGALGMVVLIVGGCAKGPSTTHGMPITRLTGGQEVPPVGGNNTGSSDIVITLTRCPGAAVGGAYCPQAYGTVTVTGFTPTVAHIHRGKTGANGPVIMTLVKTGENSFTVPQTAYVSDSDYAAFNDNELYVNVHSANNPNGEVRGQLRPTP